MEDKRIERTKKNLKKALVSLLTKSTFEHISVTNLCLEASVSRFTFYSYYGDKYELADEFFKDMLNYASNDLKSFRKKIILTMNLLKAIVISLIPYLIFQVNTWIFSVI
jgi:AcrR family transcriptional regulator